MTEYVKRESQKVAQVCETSASHHFTVNKTEWLCTSGSASNGRTKCLTRQIGFSLDKDWVCGAHKLKSSGVHSSNWILPDGVGGLYSEGK